jgi:hypothetical protein
MKRILSILKEKWPEYILEILVITIGILGAFLLNSWNEQNKDQQNANNILVDYRNDLRKDTIMLTYFIDWLDPRIEAGEKNIARIRGENATFDTVKHIAKYEHDPLINMIQAYNNSTFNSMVSAGTLSLLDLELKRKILFHDALQKQTFLEDMITNYFALTSQYHLEYPWGNEGGTGYAASVMWDIKNERDFVVKYLAMVEFRVQLLRNLRSRYQLCQTKTKEMIDTLNPLILEEYKEESNVDSES